MSPERNGAGREGRQIMSIVAIVQARLGSTRLPGKVLRNLAGRPVLSWVVDAARAIPGIDGVAVATSDAPGDDALAIWCDEQGISCHRGDEQDVLARMLVAAEAEGAELVMRITADCPLLDPSIAGMLIALQRRTGADYVSNVDPRSWPDGLDCELMTLETLRRAAAEANLSYDREHVTPWIRANEGRFTVERLICPVPGLADERWTLDQEEDLVLMEQVIARLGYHDRPPSWADVLSVLDRNPDLRAINQAAIVTGGSARPASVEPRYDRSRALLTRALKVIPTGTQTFSKSRLQFPADAPLYLSHGDGARVWDVDGNEFVDLVSALLPIVLGYRDADVDAAIRRQLAKGISFSLATEAETRLAEKLVEIIPAAEMVRFGKNGTDATSAAIRLARAATGRDRVAVGGYHGWQDWYIGSTTRKKGVPPAVQALTHSFAFGDLSSLQSVLEAHPGEFAAVILEPAGFIEPPDGYLAAVKALTHQHGAILVFDEIVTGFRTALGGAAEKYGVTPDLVALGKAMGNGMPIAAVAGRADILREMEEIFFSGTFGGEALSIAAALATIDKLATRDVPARLADIGTRLANGALERVAAAGLTDTITMGGLPCWKIMAFRDHPGGSRDAIKTVFVREMLRRGVLLAASHNVTAAFTPADEQRVLDAWAGTTLVLREELDRGDLDARLGNDIIRPTFQVRKAS